MVKEGAFENMHRGLQFVIFERVEDAKRAFEDKNNVVVPELTGNMPLQMRLKPPKVLTVSNAGTLGVSVATMALPQ